MSGRRKTRHSLGQTYKTTSNVRQRHFPTAKHTIRSKAPAWSASRQRQQTITQMDPFHAIFHPHPDQENLVYEEDPDEGWEESGRGSKRRRLLAEDTPLRKREKSTKEHSTGGSTTHAHNTHIDRETSRHRPKDDLFMHPPKATPKRSRQEEIPSSQSPADSPLSTRSRRSLRNGSASPLKERSTNATLLKSPQRRDQWPSRNEIPDSLETMEDDISTILPLTLRSGRRHWDHGSDMKRLESQSRKYAPSGKQNGSLKPTPEIGDSDLGPSTTEVIDSDADIKSDAGFEPSVETEVDLVGVSAQASRQHLDGNQAVGSALKSSPEASPPRVDRGAHRRTSRPRGLLKTKKDPPTSPSYDYPKNETEEASNQLIADLRRATQTQSHVETESQFENAWHSVNAPSLPLQESEPPMSLHYVSSSQTRAPDLAAEEHITLSTLPPSMARRGSDHCAQPSKSPAPPSQATTVDVTQPSLRKAAQHSPQGLQSSPPPVPPLSSSPLVSGKAALDAWAGYEWNGGILTDSQLLPASLMEDSYDWRAEELRMMNHDVSDEL